MLLLSAQVLPHHRGLVRKDVGAIEIGNDAVDHFAADGVVHGHVFLRRPRLGMAGHPDQRKPCRPQYTCTG